MTASQAHGRSANGEPARTRLASFLAANPDAHVRYSVTEIARVLGVSRQHAHRLLPQDYTSTRSAARLRALVKARPQALLARARGGMRVEEIVREVGVAPGKLKQLWAELHLPSRSLPKVGRKARDHRNYERRKERHQRAVRDWRRRHPDRVREIAAGTGARWRTKVLRQETCIECGATFPWTNARERHQRHVGSRVVCSRACGRRAAKRLGKRAPRQKRTRASR